MLPAIKHGVIDYGGRHCEVVPLQKNAKKQRKIVAPMPPSANPLSGGIAAWRATMRTVTALPMR